MTIEVGSLVVEMSANVARLQADVNKATGIFGNGMREMQKAADSVSRTMQALGIMQAVHTFDLMATRGAQAFGALKRSAIDTAEELNKLSQKTGFSVEALSGLKYAAELSDVSLEGMAKSLKHLSVNLVDAQHGNKEMATVLKNLGIATDDPEQALMALADRFAEMPDGAQKAALAVKLFGKEGLTMIPFLNQGRDGIREMVDEAEKFGLVISTTAARQAEAFNDNLKRLERNIAGIVQQLGNAMVPMLLEASDRLLDAKKATGSLDERIRTLAGNRDAVTDFMESMVNGALMAYAPIEALGYVIETAGSKTALAIKGFSTLGSILAVIADRGIIRGWDEIKSLNAEYERFRDVEAEAQDQRLANYGNLGRASAKFFDEYRRTVRAGNQKYLMESVEDARLLQAALEKAATGQRPKVGKDPFDGVGQEKSAYDALANSIHEKTAAELAEADAGEKLSEQQKFALKIMTDLGAGTLQLSDAQKRSVAAMLEELLAAEKLNTERKREIELQKARNEEFDETLKQIDAELAETAKGIEAWRKKAEEIEFETSVMTLSNDERERAIVLHELEAKKIDISAEEYAKLRQRVIDALGNRAELRNGMEQQVEVWQGIERTAHDTFISIFDSGKDAFTRLRDTLKNTLYELLYQMTLKKWIVNISAGVSGTGVASQAFGATDAGGGLNMLSNGSSILNLFGSGAGSMGYGLGQGLISFGNATGMQGLANFGVDMAAGQGFAGALGTALPYVGAALAVASLLGAFDSGGGPKTEGGLVKTIGGGVAELSSTGQKFFTGNGADAAVAAVLDPLATGIDELAKKLGGSASGLEIGLGFNSDPQGKAQDSVAGGVYKDGKQVYFNPRGDLERGTYGQELQVEAQRVMLAALQAVDLNDLADGYLDALDIKSLSAEAAAQAVGFVTATTQIIDAFGAIGVSAGHVSMALITALGGMDAAAQQASAYYAAYYSDAEKTAHQTQQVADALGSVGLALPATKDEFRALVESLDLTSASGQTAYATLLRVAPAFAQVADAAQQTTDAAIASAKAASDAARRALLDGVDAAYSAVERAIGAQRDIQSKALAAAQGVAEQSDRAVASLIEAMRRLRGETEVNDITLARARRDVAGMIDAARAGVLPDEGALSRAIAVMTGDTTDRYASRADFIRAQVQSAAQLDTLAGLVDAQGATAKSAVQIAEDQLAALDKQLDWAKQQVDALKGIDTRVKSVADALADFLAALDPAAKQASGTSGGAGAVPSGGAVVGPGGGLSAPTSYDYYVPTLSGNMPIADPAKNARLNDIETYLRGTYDGGSAAWMQDIYNQAQTYGVSQGEISIALGIPLSQVQEEFDKAGLPRFADGGWHSGGWAMVGERGPELAYMPPTRVYSNSDSRALVDMSPVVAKLDAIERRLAAVERHTGNTAGVFDGSRPQGQPLLMEAA